MHSMSNQSNQSTQSLQSTNSHQSSNNLIPHDNQWKNDARNPSPSHPHKLSVGHTAQMSSTPIIAHDYQQNYNNSPSKTNYSSNSNSHLPKSDSHESAGTYGQGYTPISGTGINSSTSKKLAYLENITQWKQYLVYYHFFNVEMFTNFLSMQAVIGKSELFMKLLFAMSSLVKNRSTYCLSMIVMHSKYIYILTFLEQTKV